IRSGASEVLDNDGSRGGGGGCERSKCLGCSRGRRDGDGRRCACGDADGTSDAEGDSRREMTIRGESFAPEAWMAWLERALLVGSMDGCNGLMYFGRLPGDCRTRIRT